MYMYPGPSGESTTTIFCITESTPYDLKTTSSKEYYHHQAFVRQRSQTKTKKNENQWKKIGSAGTYLFFTGV